MKLDVVYEDQSVVTLVEEETSPAVQYYQHREDRETDQWNGGLRSCVPCPAVWVLKDDPHALMDEQHQYFLWAINMAMEMEDVYLLLDKALAFANGTGFRNKSNPKADYFHRRDLSAKAPALDKVRTCSRNVLTGTEQYSLLQAFREVMAVAKTVIRRSLMGDVRQAFVRAATAQNVLNVRTFDSRVPPPLKPGRTYPSRIEDVNPDDYLYMPRWNREMFCVANIVNARGEVVQFPRGGLYAWTVDDTPYSFVPHVSNHGYGAVLYALKFLKKLPFGSAAPSVYRRIQ